jgi:hypothetical protein
MTKKKQRVGNCEPNAKREEARKEMKAKIQEIGLKDYLLIRIKEWSEKVKLKRKIPVDEAQLILDTTKNSFKLVSTRLQNTKSMKEYRQWLNEQIVKWKGDSKLDKAIRYPIQLMRELLWVIDKEGLLK